MGASSFWRVRATVQRIVDGDTFVASLDLGWGVVRAEVPGAPSRIRLLSYNTPERTDLDGWQRAVDALNAIIPPPTVVWAESRKLDSFGRALCDVFFVGLDGAAGENILTALPPEWRTS